MLFFNLTVNTQDPKILNRDAELDRALVSLSAGDDRELENIYRLTRSSVYGFALSILKNKYDAEDVMQDCYIRIFENSASYRSQGKPMAWILTITRNLALKRLNSYSKLSPEEEDFDRFIDGDDAHTNPNEQRLILKEVLAILSEEERQIVVLHAVSGLKHRQIAEILEMPLATVLSKYNRALKKLKNRLQEGEPT